MNGFLDLGCNIVFDTRISYCRASAVLLFCFSLPEIVIICSPHHDFHVLMVSSPFEFVDDYLDFIVSGCHWVCPRDMFGIWKRELGRHGSFGDIKDNGGHG